MFDPEYNAREHIDIFNPNNFCLLQWIDLRAPLSVDKM